MTARIAMAAGMMLALAGCSSGSGPQPAEPTQQPSASSAPAVTEAPQSAPSTDVAAHSLAAPPPIDPATRRIVLAQWRKAENRVNCAPVTFRNDRGEGGRVRPASFAGGWGVAFDVPGLRSAYGLAGSGFVPQDQASTRAQRARLAGQWPYFTELDALPSPSFAGYGIEGAGRYPAGNPQGHGSNSLAYVRIAGQTCDYNVPRPPRISA